MVYVTGKYDKKKIDGFRPGGTSMVETAGYRTTKQMVEEFMHAGRLLQSARKEFYDFPDGIIDPDAVVPFGRGGNIDLADASRIGNAVAARILAKQAAAKETKKDSTDDESTKVELKSPKEKEEPQK